MKRSPLVSGCLGILCIATAPFAECAETKPSPVPQPQRVSFKTADEITIVGDLALPTLKDDQKAPVAVLLHMYRSDRRAYDPLTPHLLEAGFATLAIDMRGHGESVEPKSMQLAERVAKRDKTLFKSMDKDVTAAYQFLRENHAAKIDLSRFVLVGASVGCSVALKYAAKDRSVDGVVCLTPGTDYLGIHSIKDAGKYKGRPILLLASEAERKACDALAKEMPQNAKVQIFKGRLDNPMQWHGTRMFGPVKGIEKMITDFLIAAVGKPTTQPVAASINSDVYHKPDASTVKRIKPENLRRFSSSTEAEARGLRASKTR